MGCHKQNMLTSSWVVKIQTNTASLTNMDHYKGGIIKEVRLY
jgi:hypothetical protein